MVSEEARPWGRGRSGDCDHKNLRINSRESGLLSSARLEAPGEQKTPKDWLRHDSCQAKQRLIAASYEPTLSSPKKTYGGAQRNEEVVSSQHICFQDFLADLEAIELVDADRMVPKR